MSSLHPSRPAVTELTQQTRQLTKELQRFANSIVNCIFVLNPKGTRRRRNTLIVWFLLIGFLLGFVRSDFSQWTTHLRNIFLYLFHPTVAHSFSTNPIQEFSVFLRDTYTNIAVLRYLPIFVLPFIAAWLLAAIYLADIFESEVGVARRFIMQVALFGGKQTIRIQEGDIATESENSPVFVIGGPGLVVVELDSAALFERPDGRPHVIGPTVSGPVILEGFERFRQAINLRDHRTESLNIDSRSLDGIPIQAVGVNFLFSVARKNDHPPSAQHPYPYLNNSVIETLVYGEAARVTPNGPRPSDVSKNWAGTMERLIRNALGDFMSQHNLTEYLANYGAPELQSAREQANAVIQSARRVLPREGPLPTLSVENDPPAFLSRSDIRESLFGRFTQEFPILSAQRGVELHWVGIGSWKTPNKIVPEQHLEAWKLSFDNQTRRNQGVSDLRAQYILQFIQDVPLTRFALSSENGLSHHESMVRLLIGYREQFMQILNIIDKKRAGIDARIIVRILSALRHIDRILEWPETFPAHWAGMDSIRNDGEAETPGQGEFS